MTSDEQTQNLGKALFIALENGDPAVLTQLIAETHPAEIANQLDSLPKPERKQLWKAIPPEFQGDILTHVSDRVRDSLLKRMDAETIAIATEGLDTDEVADIIVDLPDRIIKEILQSIDHQDRQRLEQILSYPEDTAGGLMDLDAVTVRENISLDVVLRYMRKRGHLPEATDNLIVVDRDDQYIGILSIRDVLINQTDTLVKQVMDAEFKPILVTKPAVDVARLFEKRDLISAPVVDEHNKLLGRITIDDVVDVLRDEADHALMGMAGMHEQEDLFAPVWVSAKSRASWLGVNLITAILASTVIAQFDTTISKMVALAVLMPIVASMGGNAGGQTLALVIRGMAMDTISPANARKLILNEMQVGFLNGLLWASIAGTVTVFWYEDWVLGGIIAIAMMINLFSAALAGILVPLTLRKIGADPALASGVVLTTITDVVGFAAFLGLAAIALSLG